jgi:hypothetical protein
MRRFSLGFSLFLFAEKLGIQTRPWRAAKAAASRRLATPSLARMLET